MSVFTDEVREQNMRIVMEKMKTTNMDFNSMIFAFADVIQSTFLSGLMVGKSPEERTQIHNEIIEMNNKLIEVLNQSDQNLMYDMVVLSNLLMDAINNATEAAREAAAARE